MTLCTMLIEKENQRIKHIFLTADTRISNDEENFTDCGQKIFNFTKNVIVAVAGDYAWFMTKVKEQLEERITLRAIQEKTVNQILNIISQVFLENLSEQEIDLDMFVVIRDTDGRELHPYLISTTDCFTHNKLSEELNLIGLNEQLQAQFRYYYSCFKKDFVPDPERPLNNVTPVLQSYIHIQTSEVSSFIIGLSIDRSHWRGLDIETGLNEGENWIYDRTTPELTWIRTVNGREIEQTTRSYYDVQDNLKKKLGSSRRPKIDK
ncbi:hypothetical protein CN324_28035 [Bacillus anthracis]|nr:hypothetical protein CN324_28035 [Bacillus anthracis]PFM07631.1 hypothetical protein COJ44_28035 [Bacillus anthracis]PFU94832.1 hypothetical protein COK92_08455 [Bacillus anthracis]PGX21657.1 hypothetical protein COE33_27555 [Bacillus anthracis]